MSGVDFGDWDEDDAYATEPADPDQVAIKLAALHARHNGDWALIALALLAWLRRQGAR